MSEIFISHAVADRRLAELLVDFLIEAIGVHPSRIFCSSVPGFGIPLTHDFNKNMRDQIQDPKLVILLMTPSYMDSSFCLMEMGATWALSLRPLPIVVSPITFNDVTKTLGLTQGWQITDDEMLQGVRKTVVEALGIPGHDGFTFDRKRSRWQKDLPEVLASLATATKVARADLDAAQRKLDASEQTVATQTREVESLTKKIAALERLRPAALIIESDNLVAMDLSQILEAQGFLIVGTARTEQEAVEIARRTKPDIITAEIVLSDGSSGLNAVTKILSIHDAFPVFITAYPEHLLANTRPEPAALITKPFDRVTLASVLSNGYAHMMRKQAQIAP